MKRLLLARALLMAQLSSRETKLQRSSDSLEQYVR